MIHMKNARLMPGITKFKCHNLYRYGNLIAILVNGNRRVIFNHQFLHRFGMLILRKLRNHFIE